MGIGRINFLCDNDPLLATGKIRKYQLLVGGLQMLNFPLSYLALWMGLSPECTFIIAVIIAFGCLLLRLYVLNAMMEFPVFIFFKTVIFNILKVSVVSVMFPVLFISNMDPSIKRFFVYFHSEYNIFINEYILCRLYARGTSVLIK